MNTLLKVEEFGLFLLCVVLFSTLNIAWWWFPALLLLPDLGMIGYVINSKAGAFTYNLVHHRLVASFVAAIAIYLDDSNWKLAAIILFAHISFDRIMGYGLKYEDSFHNTHLGIIGKMKNDK